MSWKNIPAWTDFTEESIKWKDENGIFPLELSLADNYYNEGDIITSDENVIWDLNTSGYPITKGHYPCGYWSSNPRNPNGEETPDYTSTPYAIFDSTNITQNNINLILGIFRILLHKYNYSESINSNYELKEASFRLILNSYTTEIEKLDQDFILNVGIFKVILIPYTMEIEKLDQDFVIHAINFRVQLISYQNWSEEKIDQNFSLIGGIHGS